MGKTRRRSARFAGVSRIQHVKLAVAAEYARLLRAGEERVPTTRDERRLDFEARKTDYDRACVEHRNRVAEAVRDFERLGLRSITDPYAWPTVQRALEWAPWAPAPAAKKKSVPFEDEGFAAALAQRGEKHGRRYDEARRDGAGPKRRHFVKIGAKLRRLSDRQILRRISQDPGLWDDSVWHDHKDGKPHRADWW